MKYQLYKYEWVDISHDNTWWELKDLNEKIKEEMQPIKCIGYLIKKTKDYYIFTSGYDTGNKQFFDRVIYPKGVIIKLEKL